MIHSTLRQCHVFTNPYFPNPMSQEKWALKPMTSPQFLGAKETHKDASLRLLASCQVTVDAKKLTVVRLLMLKHLVSTGETI